MHHKVSSRVSRGWSEYQLYLYYYLNEKGFYHVIKSWQLSGFPCFRPLWIVKYLVDVALIITQRLTSALQKQVLKSNAFKCLYSNAGV